MSDFAADIFNAAYSIWNTLIGVAMTLFTTSPTSASGGVYALAQSCFNALKSISIPIAIVFFLIAIIKDVMGVPPEQQARKFLQDALKFGVLVGILANLWDVMGYVMQIADGVTDSLASSGSYTITMSSDLTNTINEINALQPTVNFDHSGEGLNIAETIMQFGNDIKEWFSQKIAILGQQIFLLIAAIATLVMTIAAGMSIISSAFQRILKPLVILPFSTITVAMAAGSNEAERISTSYLKSFFGLCLSGAFMVICVKLGAALMSAGLIAFNIASMPLMQKMIFLSIQGIITPTVIAGLVKSADSMLSKFF